MPRHALTPDREERYASGYAAAPFFFSAVWRVCCGVDCRAAVTPAAMPLRSALRACRYARFHYAAMLDATLIYVLLFAGGAAAFSLPLLICRLLPCLLIYDNVTLTLRRHARACAQAYAMLHALLIRALLRAVATILAAAMMPLPALLPICVLLPLTRMLRQLCCCCAMLIFG